MAGYSATPLPRKLGIREGSALLVIGAPPDFERTLGPLPDGVTFASGGRASFNVAVAFFDRKAKLRGRLSGLRRRMVEDGGLWIAWPKQASGVATDLTEDVVRELGLATGLVDNKVCAIDETWSGLRLVIRVAERVKPAEPARKAATRPAAIPKKKPAPGRRGAAARKRPATPKNKRPRSKPR